MLGLPLSRRTPVVLQFQSQELQNFHVFPRVVNHSRIKERKHIAIESLALFFQPFILLYCLALRIKKVLDRRKQALGLFPTLTRSAGDSCRPSPSELILELRNHPRGELVMPFFIGDDETEKKSDLGIARFIRKLSIARKPPLFMICMGLEFVHETLDGGELRRLGYPPHRIFCPLTSDDLNRSGLQCSNHGNFPLSRWIFGPKLLFEESKAYATVGSQEPGTTILTLRNYLNPLSESCEDFIKKRR